MLVVRSLMPKGVEHMNGQKNFAEGEKILNQTFLSIWQKCRADDCNLGCGAMGSASGDHLTSAGMSSGIFWRRFRR